MVVAASGLVLRTYHWPVLLILSLMILLVVGLANDVWVLLSIDHNWPLDGYCSIEPNFPTWAPLDDFLPALFEVRSMCGPTPYLLFGVTMADGLAVICLVLVWVALFGIFTRISL
ncbi:MAG: disulfide bond formation protein DsbB [Bacteroidia bacterium]|jgi:disulfide bond formation protein DsbB